MKVTITPAPPSLCRVEPATRKPIRVALLQVRWDVHESAHLANLEQGIKLAAEQGAQIVFLPELTLSRYMADTKPLGDPSELAEDLLTGKSKEFASSMAKKYGVLVHISLFAKLGEEAGRGQNVALIVDGHGQVIAKTPKLHIPITAGYYEDSYFEPGPAKPNPYPVYELSDQGIDGKFGLPTCWDEWFPEVARAYSLAGAEVLVYPTAIGSEPDHPDFDTEPLWSQVIIANGVANGTFMVVPNRYGNEGTVTFYGSSFISDPFGRVLAKAGREGDEVLIADLDLDQRRDWLELFPFLATRRPDTYESLVAPIANPRTDAGPGIDGGIAGVAQ